ncbi:hypothetical protein PHPALM_1557, partial [Phytophthora palmivora]
MRYVVGTELWSVKFVAGKAGGGDDSAICSSLFHLYRGYGQTMSPEFAGNLTLFFKGLKRDVARRNHNAGVKLTPKQSSLWHVDVPERSMLIHSSQNLRQENRQLSSRSSVGTRIPRYSQVAIALYLQKRTATNAKLAREIMVISKMKELLEGISERILLEKGLQTLSLRAPTGGRTMWCRLVAAVNKAKAANMPKDKIEAAIKRGVEGKDGNNAEAVLYEASGPAGSALMIETLTDNKRRTAPALRHILGKHNGALGTNGSVAWMFERKGYLEIELPSSDGDKPEMDEDAVMEIA